MVENEETQARKENLEAKLEQAREAGGGVLSTGIQPTGEVRVDGRLVGDQTGGTELIVQNGRTYTRDVRTGEIKETGATVTAQQLEAGRRRTVAERSRRQPLPKEEARVISPTRSDFREMAEFPFGREQQRVSISQLREEQKRLKQQVYNDFAGQIRQNLERKGIQQTMTSELGIVLPKGEKRPESIRPEIARGIRQQMAFKQGQQTISEPLFGEKVILTPGKDGIPVISKSERILKGAAEIPISFFRGLGEIEKEASMAGIEVKAEDKARKAAGIVDFFGTVKRIGAKTGEKIKEKAKTDKDVQTALAGITLLSLPSPVQKIIGDVLLASEAIGFAEEPSYEKAGRAGFFASPSLIGPIGRKITEAELMGRFKNQLVLRKDLAPEIIERGLSVDVLGRPVELIRGVQVKAGPTTRTKLEILTGKEQPIDINKPSSDYVLLTGKQSQLVKFVSPGVKSKLPSTKLGRQDILAVEKPISKITKAENINTFLGGEQFEASDIGALKIRKVTKGKEGVVIRETTISKEPTSNILGIRAAEARVSPFEFSTEKGIIKKRVPKGRKPPKDIRSLTKPSELFLLENIKVKKEPVIIKGAGLVRIFDPTTGAFFEIKKKQSPFNVFTSPKQTSTIGKDIDKFTGDAGLVQVLIKPETKTKTQAKTLKQSKQEQVSVLKQEQKQKSKDFQELNKLVGAKSKSRLDAALARRTKAKTRSLLSQKSLISLSILSAQRQSQKMRARQKARQASDIMAKQDISIIQDQQSLQDTALDTQQLQQFGDSFIDNTFFNFQQPPKIPRIPKPPKPPKKPSVKKPIRKKMPGKLVQGYVALVKKPLGKSYIQANKKPLTKAQATNLGARVVDKYVNRSFMIRKIGKARPSRQSLNRGLLGRFRKAKKNGNIFVEKSKHAISSREEKLGIPYKAKMLRRKKK